MLIALDPRCGQFAYETSLASTNPTRSRQQYIPNSILDLGCQWLCGTVVRLDITTDRLCSFETQERTGQAARNWRRRQANRARAEQNRVRQADAERQAAEAKLKLVREERRLIQAKTILVRATAVARTKMVLAWIRRRSSLTMLLACRATSNS